MEENTLPPALPAPQPAQPAPAPSGSKTWIFVVVALVLLGLTVWAIIAMLNAEPAVAGQIRDIFIIFMALEAFVIGVALIILIVQIAALTNMLKNEVKPILDHTNDTVNTLRGTALFLGDNLVDPVIKMNEYLAGLKRFFDLLRPGK